MQDEEPEVTAADIPEELPSDILQVFRTPIARGSSYVAQPAPGHDVHGLWHVFNASSRTGYATHAVALHWALSAGKAPALPIPTQLVPHRHHDIDIETLPADRHDMLFGWIKSAVGHPHLLLCSYPPDVAAAMAQTGPGLIPYCAFEGTHVSRYVAELCAGDTFREVWVVSPFVKCAFVAAAERHENIDAEAFERRIHVIEPALWGGPWTGLGHSESRLLGAECPPVTEEDPFVFGAMGTWHARKGFDRLVKAYWQGFSRDEPVVLELRTSAFGSNRTIREFKEGVTLELAEIARQLGDDDFPNSKRQARIKMVLGTDATDAEVIEWLGLLDCYANATFGEGLGIPHVWAKCQGVPMVSSEFGAVGEMLWDIREDGGVDDELFQYITVPVAREMPTLSLMFDRDCEWGDYDIADLTRAMQRQFERGRRVDARGALYARERYSLAAMVNGNSPKSGTASLRGRLYEHIDPQVSADLGFGSGYQE